MSLIGALITGTVAYRREKERLANKAEAASGGRDRLDFGPGLSFDESNAIFEGMNRLAGQHLDSTPKSFPTVNTLRPDYPTYSPPKKRE